MYLFGNICLPPWVVNKLSDNGYFRFLLFEFFKSIARIGIYSTVYQDQCAKSLIPDPFIIFFACFWLSSLSLQYKNVVYCYYTVITALSFGECFFYPVRDASPTRCCLVVPPLFLNFGGPTYVYSRQSCRGALYLIKTLLHGRFSDLLCPTTIPVHVLSMFCNTILFR